MKRKIFSIIIILIIAALPFKGFAQYQADALTFAKAFYTGSAKSAAMGSSLSAVGADFTNMATNPAGLGVYRNSAIEFTPYFIFNSSEALFNGNLRKEEKFGLPIANLGFVAAIDLLGDWKQVNFGLSYNRTNEFRQEIIASGDNPNGSILDYYVYNANTLNGAFYGDRWEPTREGLAWETYLLDKDTNGEYYSHVIDEGAYGATQRRAVDIKGGMGEWDFSMAANYNDFLYVGGTIGAIGLNYNKTVHYSEDGFAPVYRTNNEGEEVLANPESLSVYENLNMSGTGVNLKAGFLMQPVKFIRFGASIHSPTFQRINEYYETRMSSEFPEPDQNGDRFYDTEWQHNEFDWRIRTPFRVNAGLAFILGSTEIGNFYSIPMTFSFGYEYADYSQMHLKPLLIAEDYERDNSYIDKYYGEAHSFNSGAELNFGMLKLRGGYALYTSPFKADENIMDNAIQVISGGLGISWDLAYIDFAHTVSTKEQSMGMYDAAVYYPENPMGEKEEPNASITSVLHQSFVTFGLRFN